MGIYSKRITNLQRISISFFFLNLYFICSLSLASNSKNTSTSQTNKSECHHPLPAKNKTKILTLLSCHNFHWIIIHRPHDYKILTKKFQKLVRDNLKKNQSTGYPNPLFVLCKLKKFCDPNFSGLSAFFCLECETSILIIQDIYRFVVIFHFLNFFFFFCCEIEKEFQFDEFLLKFRDFWKTIRCNFYQSNFLKRNRNYMK